MSLNYSHHKQTSSSNNNTINNTSNNNASRVFIPRDWRDNLARAINERDLARIEHLIDFGHQNNHTKFNDPLVADAAFLLQMAQENSMKRFQLDIHYHHNTNNSSSSLHHDQQRNNNNNISPKRRGFQNPTPRATKSKLADDTSGGSMSWVAPPLVSLVSGPLDRKNHSNNNNQSSLYGSRSVSASYRDSHPLGNTASLREKVSQLREMALFPDSTVTQMYDNLDDSSLLSSSNRQQQTRSSVTSAYINPNNTTTMSLNGGGASTSSLINQHRMIYSKGIFPSSRSITEDAAAAMGVPALWIDRPVGLTWDPNADRQNHKNNDNFSPSSAASASASPPLKKKTHYPYSGETGENKNTSPIRSVFEDPSITGAALRLHSFVHAEEEPAIKSSRLFAAYVAMERLAPKEENINSNKTSSSSPSPQRKNNQQESQQPTTSTFPSSDYTHRQNDDDNEAANIYSSSSSPEHVRMVRKLNHEASAPNGAELSRMLRFLSATEMMNRGCLEQEAEGMLRSGVANYRYGLLHSRGISSDRSAHDHQNQVFLNN